MFGEYWADFYAIEAGYRTELFKAYRRSAFAFIKMSKEFKFDSRILEFVPNVFECLAHWAALGERSLPDRILRLLPADVAAAVKPHHDAFLNPASYQSPDKFLKIYLAFTQTLREAAGQGALTAGLPSAGA